MKPIVLVKAAVVFCVALLVISSARAQFLDSSAGLGAGLVKVFGETKAFSARADVRVTANKVETLRAPMNFSLLNGNIRMEFDLATAQSKQVQPGVIKMMTQAGLNQVISIIRMDKRVNHLVFPRAQSYLDMEITKEEAEGAEKNVQVTRTPLGRETIDNHPCAKTKVVVKNAQSAVLLDAIAWNAEDMKSFPLQIAVQGREGTTVIRFSNVQLAAPVATQFAPPARFKKHDNLDSLFLAASQKNFSPITRTATAPTVQSTNKAPNKPVATKAAPAPSPATKPAVKKAPASNVQKAPVSNAGKTNAVPARPQPAKK